MRPEWISCIRKPHESEKHLSWCGRNVGSEFHLTGLDHAACLQNDRLVPCPSCVDSACAELKRLASEATAPAAPERKPTPPQR